MIGVPKPLRSGFMNGEQFVWETPLPHSAVVCSKFLTVSMTDEVFFTSLSSMAQRIGNTFLETGFESVLFLLR